MAFGTYSLLFATGEPACAVGRDGAIVAWNAAAARAFGYSAAQAVGRKCWELLQGRDAFDNPYCSAACPLRETALQHQAVNRCRMSFCTADGGMQTFTVTTLALFESREAVLIHLFRPVEAAETRTTPERLSEPTPERAVLTPREHQVLGHLADGHTTREIATLLSISMPTVRSHIEHILHKLHAHSRLEAVAVSRRLGLH